MKFLSIYLILLEEFLKRELLSRFFTGDELKIGFKFLKFCLLVKKIQREKVKKPIFLLSMSRTRPKLRLCNLKLKGHKISFEQIDKK